MIFGSVQRKIALVWRKNGPEISALFSGKMPQFIWSSGVKGIGDEMPVFVFHQVTPDHLEKQFQYLTSNEYKTLTADELQEAVCNYTEKENFIAITFDDAAWSFWAYAFPLLKKYKLKSILFVSPGLISEDPAIYPNLDDVWEGRCSTDDVSNRGKTQTLCTWRELVIMHESGNVDIQSHSVTHARIPISGRVMDFLHPDFDSGSFGNVGMPVSSLDDPKYPERQNVCPATVH
jgi:hypothetical protein